MRNGVSDEYQTDTPKYSFDTRLILGWYFWYWRDYQRSIRWVSDLNHNFDQYVLLCFTDDLTIFTIVFLFLCTYLYALYCWYAWYCAEIVAQSYRRVEDITGKQTIYNPCGLKVVSSIVVDLIHLPCELHVCAVGTFVLLVVLVSQEHTTIGEDP